MKLLRIYFLPRQHITCLKSYRSVLYMSISFKKFVDATQLVLLLWYYFVDDNVKCDSYAYD